MALAAAAAPQPASADRPTSGDMSIISGRTMGNGETALAAGVGWPGIWAQVLLAPSSTFNLGFRGSVLYGSPVMGLGSGVGGGLSVPVRLHLLGKGYLDVALALEPGAFMGEGSLAGQEVAFAHSFGYGATCTLALLAGAQVSGAITVTLGAGGDFVYYDTPSAGAGRQLGATGLGIFGLEALVSRDTLLFLEVRGGYGFAPERLFDGHEVVRFSLGLAYLL